MGFLTEPKTVEALEEENERTAQQLSIAEKKALINKLKKQYGRDWKLHMPKITSGFDWDALRFKVR